MQGLYLIKWLQTLLYYLIGSGVWLALSLPVQAEGRYQTESFNEREWLLYVPDRFSEKAHLYLLIVLHGGAGNAQFIQRKLAFEQAADQLGMVVAYLNGSVAARLGGAKFKAWNAGGGCCGKPYRDQVDDISYISEAVETLQSRYHVSDVNKLAVGHSNGGMMLQTMVCTTETFQKVVTHSATLMVDPKQCAKAVNNTIINIHGELDENVPIAGGIGEKGFLDIPFTSQKNAQHIFESAGGRYQLVVLPKAAHSLKDLDGSARKFRKQPLVELILEQFSLTAR